MKTLRVFIFPENSTHRIELDPPKDPFCNSGNLQLINGELLEIQFINNSGAAVNVEFKDWDPFAPIFPTEFNVPEEGSTENAFVTGNPGVGCYSFSIYLDDVKISDPELEIILELNFYTATKHLAAVQQQVNLLTKQNELLIAIERKLTRFLDQTGVTALAKPKSRKTLAKKRKKK
jgi:hypothetical protein